MTALLEGDSVRLTAVPLTRAGVAVTAAPVAWTSGDTAVLTVTSAGLVRAVRTGSAQIVATVGAVSSGVTLRVDRRPPRAVGLDITTATRSVLEADSLALRATLRMSDSTTADASPVAWQSGDSSVAVVATDARGGAWLRTRRPGSVELRATAAGVSATATITVQRADVARVTLAPASIDLEAGRTVQLAVTVLDARGLVLSGRSPVFAVRDPNVLRIDAAGLATGTAEGSTMATATVEGVSASIAVRVRRRSGLTQILDSIRTANDVPALAGAIVTVDGIWAADVVGMRRAGGSVAARLDDQFHLGSNTKAVTAGLLGLLVDAGKLRWTATLAELFPELAGSMRAEYRAVTVRELLSQQSGMPRDAAPSFFDQTPPQPPATQLRTSLVAWAVQQPPVSARGTYFYTNVNYIIAGAIAERVTGRSYEQLVIDDLLTPLGITTAGFGAAGTPGQEDQPWQHYLDASGRRIAVAPSPTADNPPIYGPAGRLHMSIGDWARWIQTVLRAERGMPSPWTPATAKLLTTPQVTENASDSYAFGWVVTYRSWAGPTARVLTHNGSNTMNFSTAWIAPDAGYAFIAITNQGGDMPARVVDETAGRMINLYLTGR